MSEASFDLGRAVKDVDAWWTVAVIDPIAVRVLPLLLRFRRLTPNVVTALAFVVGVVAVGAFAAGHLVVGAVLYEARFFLDCLDGKIARVKGLSSPKGAMFDRLADTLTVPAAYAAIGFVLAGRGDLSSRLALLLPVGALAVASVEAVLDLVKERRPAPPAGAVPAPAPAVWARSGATAVAAESVMTGGLVGWARRHRFTLRPWTVEAETLGLFLGPLLLRSSALAGLQLAIAGVYALFVAVDLVLVFRTVGTSGRAA